MTARVTVLASIPGPAVGELLQVLFVQGGSVGPVSVPGLQAGDVMLTLSDMNTNNNVIGNNLYEAIVSTNNQIMQKQATTTPHQMSAVFYRALS